MLKENIIAWVNNNKQFYKDGESLKANSIAKWYYSDFDDFAQKKLKIKGAGAYLGSFIKDGRQDATWIKNHLNENFNDRSSIVVGVIREFSFFYDWQINDVRNYK